MDAHLKKILAELPIKPPRSRLEPYREFIEELRSRGRTYRDIAEILAEKCAVRVTGSGIHDYIRSRSRVKARHADSTKPNPLLIGNPAPDALPTSPSGEDVQRKIAALTGRTNASDTGSGRFEYDPDEPLRLKRQNRN
jgi:hypothetical protein